MKQSGGHVNIYSEVGEGATVRLSVPRSHAAGSADEDPPLLQEQAARGNETILVVEDDEQVRNFVCDTLAELNYKVVRASDAAAALRIIDQSPNIDLLLTDVVMPGMDGRLLCNCITKRRPAIRVLFMTGYSRNAIVHQGPLEPGVPQMIQKPLTQSSLAAKVRDVLDLAKVS